MENFSIQTPSEQVANHLRAELLKERWSGKMPGTPVLAKELGINHKTVGLALKHLEQEGLLVGQGQGRPRMIVLPENHIQPTLRVGLLDWGAHSLDRRLTHDLEQVPYTIVTSSKTLEEINSDINRLKKHVQSVNVDAWIVYAGPREVLEWFSRQPLPTFAMFGYMSDLPIAGAGPHSPTGFIDCVQKLVALGHNRIVMLTPHYTRLPEPNKAVLAFRDTLEAEGIQTGSYHLPDWGPGDEGLHTMLESLFKTTPPTVLIINDKVTYFAVLQFLMERGIRVPGDVSLVCHEFIHSITWCDDPIAYIHWDWAPITKRLLDWMSNVSLNREDNEQDLFKPRFVSGRTLGPPT